MRDKIILALVIAAGMTPVPALADSRNDVIAGMTRCAVLTDDRQWLDCYYGAAQPMRAQLGLKPAPQSQLRLLSAQPAGSVMPETVARAAVHRGPPPKPRSSGIFNIMGGDDVVTNSPVTSYAVNKNGFTVTLPDGETWSQTARDAIMNPVRWRQPAASMRVTISQGAVHTFNLVLNDENQHYKVERVR